MEKNSFDEAKLEQLIKQKVAAQGLQVVTDVEKLYLNQKEVVLQ